MNTDELKIKLQELVPAVTFEEGNEWPTINIESRDWPSLAKRLRYDEQLLFDYLFFLTFIDWKSHLTMVYHVSSTNYRHTIVVKSKLDRDDPQIETVCRIWRTAEFHEREVYEMFGVKFLSHPDLRLLIL